jgi:hypothetical protein
MARLFKTGITAEGVLTSNGLTLSSTTSPIILNAAAGTSGQVLTSAGAGATPTWTSVSGTGTVTSITAGTNGLTGGTITTSGTIDIDTAKVPRLTTNTNTFQASSGSTKFVVKKGPTQDIAVNLMEWQTDSGAVGGFVRNDANLINFGAVESTYFMTATAGTSTNVPMTVYGKSDHTANIQEWRKLGEANPRAVINQYGDLYLPGSAIQIGTSYLTAKISVAPGAAEHGLVIRGASGQSANLQEWQNNTPTTVASVSPTGAFTTAGQITSSHSGLWSSPNITLQGTEPNIRFAATSSVDANVGVYNGVFYVVGDTASDGTYDTIPLSVNLTNGNTSILGTMTASTFSGSGASLTNLPTPTAVVNTVSGTTSAELVRGNMADNDQFRILVGGTAGNSGFAEIATADDGNEPIHVRQYTGVFATIARTATLLDGSGNTSFPGTIDTPGISRSGTSSLSISTATGTTGTAGNINITAGGMDTSGTGGNVIITGGTVSSGNGGNISINAGAGGTSGTISIGTTNASSISIGRSGLTTTTAGAFTADGTVTGGNLTTGGTLTRTTLNGGGTSGASINNSGQFIRTPSSARYKQDIEDGNFVYEDILSLSPKTFRLKDEAETNPDARVYGGFIAEEVDQIESLKVFVNYLTQEDGSVVPDGIAYGEMVSALVSAIKHQDARIQALEAQVQALSS